MGECFMLEIRNNEILIVEGLQKALNCLVIRANQTAPAPPYPYISYTIITPSNANNGTWGRYDDGIDRIPVTQTWSFTAQSNDMVESTNLAINARNWLQHEGAVYLNDNHITVQTVEDITNRDNFLTVEYEYRNGFDVVFWLLDEMENTTEAIGTIDYVAVGENLIEPEESVDELNKRLEKRLHGVI